MKTTEIKVKYVNEENCLEIWKVISPEAGMPKYYGRDISDMERDWVYVADPEGYREKEGYVSDDVVFVICNEKKKECLRDSNGNHNPDFKTKEETIMEAWDVVSGQIPVVHNIANWLHTFLDKEWMQKLTEQGKACIYHNWLYWDDVKEETVLHEFEFAGIPMCIYELTCEHRYCHQVYQKYYAGRKNRKEYETYDKCFGYVLPKEEGRVESIWSARRKVEEELQKQAQEGYVYQMTVPLTYGTFRKVKISHAACEIVKEKRILKEEMQDFLNEIWNGYFPTKKAVLESYPDAIELY